jgi:hypothetical protein
MGKRRRKSGLTKRLSDPKVRKEAKATLVSALGIIPILGTALSILNTTEGAMKTARAAKKAGIAVKRKVRRRSRGGESMAIRTKAAKPKAAAKAVKAKAKPKKAKK